MKYHYKNYFWAFPSIETLRCFHWLAYNNIKLFHLNIVAVRKNLETKMNFIDPIFRSQLVTFKYYLGRFLEYIKRNKQSMITLCIRRGELEI